MYETLRKAMIEALEAAPCSTRKLAREAGVSHALLQMVRDGNRTCTPQVAKAVADALEKWSRECQVAAQGLREALEAENG
jgi:lambda repressor-like predicted transcriptional regulator